mmetsp:Transcript_4811/g.11500  ORF Transcript_4811/g.11500 Transcript_4811/m.11500 type:complete len:298 (-) Transcript_4811:354-1247(-)
MCLDVIHVGDGLDVRHLVELLNKVPEVGILLNALAIALEVDDIDRVEPHKRHVQLEIHPSEGVATQIPLLGQNALSLLKAGKELVVRILVCLLRLGKTTSVDSVVDIVVDERVEILHLLGQTLGEKVEGRVLGELVEALVEHQNYLRRLVANNGLLLLVPQNRDRVLLASILRQFIDIANKRAVVDKIWNASLAVVRAQSHLVGDRSVLGILEHPSSVRVDALLGELPRGMRDRHTDHVLQSLHVHDAVTPVGPRTRIRSIEMIPASLCGKLGVRLFRDPVAPLRFDALELALVIDL